MHFFLLCVHDQAVALNYSSNYTSALCNLPGLKLSTASQAGEAALLWFLIGAGYLSGVVFGERIRRWTGTRHHLIMLRCFHCGEEMHLAVENGVGELIWLKSMLQETLTEALSVWARWKTGQNSSSTVISTDSSA
ncbi:hypothetical protein MRB53_040567 [Persea americana]|nr:hypothetical protein MRB53_040567 [Persea americana]